MNEISKKPKNTVDDKYKSAARGVVDEALAAHNLAPAIRTAIIEDKPLNDALQDVIVSTVKRNPDMRDALVETIADGKAIKKSRVDYKQPGFWIPIVISSIVGLAAVVVAIVALFVK